MAEAGGPTTQSGIHYQNSIAALFLGRLLDPRQRIARDRVIEVRVEAPEYVDDIIIRHADGSRLFIQAKEALSLASAAWGKLWKDFSAQSEDCRGEDFRLVLVVGKFSPEIDHLRELCERAQGKKDHEEWLDSLSSDLKSVAIKIVNALPEPTDNAAFQLIRFVEVWIWPLSSIDRDNIPIWIPSSSVPNRTLFELLLGQVGGKARIRGLFNAVELLEKLETNHKILIHDVSRWGIDAYRQAIKIEMGTLSVPGTSLSGPIDELFLWLPLHDRANKNAHIDFEEEDPRWRLENIAVEETNLREFPRGKVTRAVIDAGAGFGKTTMLHAIAYRLSLGIRVPALISLDALSLSDTTVLGYLNDKVNTEYDVSIDWERLCETGRAVILFDGLDELSSTDRTNVLQKIIKFLARFPNSAFILTVRDSAVLSVPLGVSVLTLSRLDDSSISQFTDAYARHGGRLSAKILSSHLKRHPDLGYLLKIPLFLALVLASVGPEDDLPRSRSELLEHYLSLLFSPERYKSLAEPYALLSDLRESAELLAWGGLEADRIGLTEIEAKRLLRGQGLTEQSDIYIERLVRIGVLRRVTTRLQFTYPIVQEYLAACWMINNAPKEIGLRFTSITRRPWAQALQFALEMYPEAEQIISNQIDVPDDAFYTTLRLIARCIVNGAKISTDLKNRIGDRLAEVWPSESYSIRTSIGCLIADGFLDPLPSKVVEHISRWGIQSGGAEILAAKALPSLTRKILKAQLSGDIKHQYHLHGWQEVVDDIADEALDLYLKRARDKLTSENEFEALASLIANLSPSRLNKDSWQKAALDLNLPPIIRLGGYFLAPMPIPQSAWETINEILTISELNSEHIYEHRAFQLFWRMQDAEEHFIQLLYDTSVTEKRIRCALVGLVRSNLELEKKLAILRSGSDVSGLSEDIHFLILFCLAYSGDEAAEQESVEMLSSQNVKNIIVWLSHANKFSEQSVCRAAEILSAKQYSSEDLVSLIGNANFGLSYETELYSFDGAAGKESRHHPARQKMINSLMTCLNDEDDSFNALKIRAEFVDHKSSEELISAIRIFLNTIQGFMSYEDDNKINSALYALEKKCLLPFDILLQIIDKSSSNAGRAAINQLVYRGDERNMLELLERYNLREKNDFVREGIFSGLETLAGRYGKRVVRFNDNLCIEQF